VAVSIRTLDHLTEEDVAWTTEGYVSEERYRVTRTETPERVVISLDLESLPRPYVKHWDKPPEWTLNHYRGLLAEGLSIGAYEGDRLVGLLIAERRNWNKTLWIWEFHVRRPGRSAGHGGRDAEYQRPRHPRLPGPWLRGGLRGPLLLHQPRHRPRPPRGRGGGVHEEEAVGVLEGSWCFAARLVSSCHPGRAAAMSTIPMTPPDVAVTPSFLRRSATVASKPAVASGTSNPSPVRLMVTQWAGSSVRDRSHQGGYLVYLDESADAEKRVYLKIIPLPTGTD